MGALSHNYHLLNFKSGKPIPFERVKKKKKSNTNTSTISGSLFVIKLLDHNMISGIVLCERIYQALLFLVLNRLVCYFLILAVTGF